MLRPNSFKASELNNFIQNGNAKAPIVVTVFCSWNYKTRDGGWAYCIRGNDVELTHSGFEKGPISITSLNFLAVTKALKTAVNIGSYGQNIVVVSNYSAIIGILIRWKKTQGAPLTEFKYPDERLYEMDLWSLLSKRISTRFLNNEEIKYDPDFLKSKAEAQSANRAERDKDF